MLRRCASLSSLPSVPEPSKKFDLPLLETFSVPSTAQTQRARCTGRQPPSSKGGATSNGSTRRKSRGFLGRRRVDPLRIWRLAPPPRFSEGGPGSEQGPGEAAQGPLGIPLLPARRGESVPRVAPRWSLTEDQAPPVRLSSPTAPRLRWGSALSSYLRIRANLPSRRQHTDVGRSSTGAPHTRTWSPASITSSAASDAFETARPRRSGVS